MEHEKNTRSKLGGVSSRGKGGEENVKTSESTDREKLQQAERWLGMRLACRAYKTIPCFITAVLYWRSNKCFLLPYSFRYHKYTAHLWEIRRLRVMSYRHRSAARIEMGRFF